MAIVIPQEDCWLFQVMFVAQNAEGRRGEYEQASISCRQPQPARDEDTEKMAMAEEQDIAVKAPQARDHVVGAGANRRSRLTPGQPSRNKYQPGLS